MLFIKTGEQLAGATGDLRKNMNANKCISSLSSDGATLAKVIATFSVVLTHSYKLFGYMAVDGSSVLYLRGFHAFASCGVPVFFLLWGIS